MAVHIGKTMAVLGLALTLSGCVAYVPAHRDYVEVPPPHGSVVVVEHDHDNHPYWHHRGGWDDD